MSLLDDARKLADLPCAEHGYEHFPDCLQLAVVPRIVAALEAAEHLAERFDRFNDGSADQEEIPGGLYMGVREFVAALRSEDGRG